MKQMTVEKLYNELKVLVEKGKGNKLVVLSNDNEGNGYHGCFYSCTTQSKRIKALLKCSSGEISDSTTQDARKIIIIG